MRVSAIITRIMRQFFRDKRTLSLLIFAPLLVLTLMDYVFTEHDTVLDIGVANENIKNTLYSLEEDNNLIIMTEDEAKDRFKNKNLDAFIISDKLNLNIILQGYDNSINAKVNKAIQTALKDSMINSKENVQINISNYYGNDDMRTIDYLGPVLIGFFIFFFVFLISGVSFLRERTTGTLERLLATPVKRYEIVLGYLVGFGIFTVFQSSIISFFSIWILGIYNAGSVALILIVTIIIALCALSFGMFLSAFADNEFQIIQFIPLVIVPQAFFSGLFPIRGMIEPLQILSKIMPLTYAAEALRDVTIRGASFIDILPDLGVLIGFAVVFAILNIIALKKHRIW